MRDLLQPHAANLVAKAMELAKAGDTTAPRICLDRCIPVIKARDEPVVLHVMGQSLADNSRAIVAAMVNGELSPEVAATVLQGLAAQTRIIETDEIEHRITALLRAA